MKKKILITGMNTLQVTEDFYKRQQLQVIPSHTSLIACYPSAIGRNSVEG